MYVHEKLLTSIYRVCDASNSLLLLVSGSKCERLFDWENNCYVCLIIADASI